MWKEDSEFRALLYILLGLLASGTLFYHQLEHWSIVDSIYFCIMTISTIGYGDYSPSTDVSKIFTIFLALGGIGVFVAIATKVARGPTSRKIERHKKNPIKNEHHYEEK